MSNKKLAEEQTILAVREALDAAGIDLTTDAGQQALKQNVEDNLSALRDSPEYQAIDEPTTLGAGFVDAAEAPSQFVRDNPSTEPYLGNAAAGIGGAVDTVGDWATRGIPDRIGQALDALGVKTDLRKDAAANDTYKTGARTYTEGSYPISSAVGGAVPDLAAAYLLPKVLPKATAIDNEFRILPALEKGKNAGLSALQALGLGAASEGMRYGEQGESFGDTGDRVLGGAAFGLGGDLVGRGAAATKNWLSNAANKVSKDTGMQDFLKQVNPAAAKLSERLGKRHLVRALNSLTTKTVEKAGEHPKSLLDEVLVRGQGADHMLPPSVVGTTQSFARSIQAPAAKGVRAEVKADPRQGITQDYADTLNSVLRGDPQTYASRVSTIQMLKGMANDPKVSTEAAKGYSDMARQLDEELDSVVAASGKDRLSATHSMQRGAQNMYATNMKDFLPDSGTSVSKYIDGKMPEDMLRTELLHPEMGMAAEDYGRAVPGSKKYFDAMFANEHLGKTPLGNNTATERAFGDPSTGKLSQATEAFLERIDREPYVSGIVRRGLNRFGVGADSQDLAKLNTSVLKYGAKPAQQHRSLLASALRGMIGAELGRFDPSMEYEQYKRLTDEEKARYNLGSD